MGPRHHCSGMRHHHSTLPSLFPPCNPPRVMHADSTGSFHDCSMIVQPIQSLRFGKSGHGCMQGGSGVQWMQRRERLSLAPFSLTRARQSPEQLGAAVQVLQVAVMLHPTLAEALLLPTNLSDSTSPGSNKVGRKPDSCTVRELMVEHLLSGHLSPTNLCNCTPPRSKSVGMKPDIALLHSHLRTSRCPMD